MRRRTAPLSASLISLVLGCAEPENLPLPPAEGGDVDFCGELPLETGAKVLFVLDKSGTMFADELDWDHDDDPDTADIHRWTSLYSVVELVVEKFDDRLSLGALLFPSVASACNVNQEPEIPISANNGAALLAALPGADDTFDAYHLTPLPTALEIAVEYMLGFDEEDAKAIILVSDGVPSAECDGTMSDATATVGAAWEEHGIPTYVVGVAIEQENATEYGLLAAAGGHPDPNTSFYDTQDELQLQAAVETIADSIPDCRIKLDEIPAHPELLGIRLGGEDVPGVGACSDGDGWFFVDDEHRVIELCGAPCEALLAGETDVVASYGCPDADETAG